MTRQVAQVMGAYYYKDDEGQFNLERQLGWCNGCQSITAIEDFRRTSKVASEIRSELELISLKTGYSLGEYPQCVIQITPRVDRFDY